MLPPIFTLVLIYCLQVLAIPGPTTRDLGPTVQLDDATFVGTSGIGISKWLGIPFAQPPTGDLRFQLPKPISSYNGTQTVASYGPSCPQQAFTLPLPEGLVQEAADFLFNSVYNVITPDSEDCLTINVVAPADATPASNLPVVVWIFGGAFEFGSTTTYDGGVIVSRSIAIDEPVIYVSMNYRLSAFGFLASQEIKDAGVGNLGLQDQREALRWIQKYIGAFGGDPTKVTIWGESAGAISVALHMLTNDGNVEGLFRAGFMESGSPIPVGDMSHGQKYYDFIVNETGCSGASDSLQCLRGVDYSKFKSAMDATPALFTYQSLDLAYWPRVDGVFLKDVPQQLVLQGSVADVPFITGDCDDEGTLFSLSNTNVTTDEQFMEYMQSNYLSSAPAEIVNQLATYYPSDIIDGSPFNTGILNAISPQFKRLAAIQGDLLFQGPRRFFAQQRADKQKVWSYSNQRLKLLPILGSAHLTDLLNVYADGDMADYLINFAATLDPNSKTTLLAGQNWPQYTNESRTLLVFKDGLEPLGLTEDTYRADAIEFGTQVMLDYPL